jgi:hypothetical protein
MRKGLFLLFVFVVLARCEAETNTTHPPEAVTITKEWKASVDDVILQHHVVGLAATFTPDYLAQRDHITTLRAQTAALRGHVLFALLTCIDSNLTVDIPPHFSQYALEQVVRDFEKQGFKIKKDLSQVFFSNLPAPKI